MDESSLTDWLAVLFSRTADPGTQAIRDTGIVLLSLLVGVVLRSILVGSHVGRKIDLLFSSPRQEGTTRLEVGPTEGFRPVRVFGWLVILSALGAGVLFVSGWHGFRIGREFVWPLLRAGWWIAAVAVVAALAARTLARNVLDLFEDPPVSEALDRVLPAEKKGAKTFSRVVGDGLVILIYAGIAVVGAAVVLDKLGLSVAPSLLRLAAVCVGLAGLTVLLFVVVAFRDPIAEIGASIYLKVRKIDRVTVNGKSTKIRKRSHLSCECEQEGKVVVVPNRALMNAALGIESAGENTTTTETTPTGKTEEPTA